MLQIYSQQSLLQVVLESEEIIYLRIPNFFQPGGSDTISNVVFFKEFEIQALIFPLKSKAEDMYVDAKICQTKLLPEDNGKYSISIIDVDKVCHSEVATDRQRLQCFGIVLQFKFNRRL